MDQTLFVTPARTRPPVHAAGPDNDWSVCTTWIVTRKKLWYLGDVWRQRVDYPPLTASVQTLAKRWNARRVLVEDAGAGTSLVKEASRTGFGNHRRKARGR
ncbi:MAG: hypothetical protein WA231_19440 [Methylocella sp.]